MKVFVCDLSRCNGCRSCQIVCKDEHGDVDWGGYAAPQPETGQFWMDVKEEVRGAVPVVRTSFTPTLCCHCDECVLADVAPEAVQKRSDGMVIIDPVKAKGNRALVDACPHHVVFWNEALELPQKCTGCAHLLDDGWAVPRCVDVCPTGAWRFGEEEEFADEIARGEAPQPVSDLGPRVYYLNVPKRFIAGCLVDFQRDEVAIDVAVRLKDAAGETCYEARTDELGDFLFDDVEPRAYVLEIQASSGAMQSRPVDVTEKDIVLGDIEFSDN